MPEETEETRLKECSRISIDIFLVLVLFLPVIILWWAGTWQLMDLYLFRTSFLHSSYASLAIGSFICLVGHLLQPFLGYSAINYPRLHFILLRLFVYIYACGYINYFRGIWNLTDALVQLTDNHKVLVSVLTLVVCEFLLLISRTSASPFTICIDSSPSFCTPALLFRTQFGIKDLGPFIADVIVTHFGITTIIVLTWHSIWDLIKYNLYPNDLFKSYIVCLIAGYILSVLLLCIPRVLNSIAKCLSRIHPIIAFIFVEIMKLFALASALFIWRGAWRLLENYVLVMVPWRSWLCHYGSFSLLATMQVCTVLAPVGCARDDTALIYLSLDWSIDYISYKPVHIEEVIVRPEGENTAERDNEETRPLLPQVEFQ